jgi:NTP pyrophosphatase (non-canonical NTP hydrolase)
MELNKLAAEIHANAKAHGWWENEIPFPEFIALCHSELSEALEAYRNGCEVDEIKFTCMQSIYAACCGKKCEDCVHAVFDGVPIELADCIIRILDYCRHAGIDIEEAIRVKHKYNSRRPYRHGNKRC